jgi:predicted ATPase
LTSQVARIVKNAYPGNESPLTWVDRVAFARRAIELAIADLTAASGLTGWVFFDRALVDAAAALQHLTGELALAALGAAYRYHERVFFTPPWAEIYVKDSERRHSFDDAGAEYDRLSEVYPSLRYEVVTPERAEHLRPMSPAGGGGRASTSSATEWRNGTQ